MTRRLRPLTPEIAELVPDMCVGCVFWESEMRLEARCGAASDIAMLKRWISQVSSEWGECGRVALEDGEVLGFVKYAPPGYFPQARSLPAGPPTGDAPLIACLHIVGDARQLGLGKVLLQAALRDLTLRGERAVESYGVAGQLDYSASPLIGVEFLLRMGFQVQRPHPDMPLMRLDLRSLATLREDLENVLESLRLPLRSPSPVATPHARCR
jgi:GNAT superfamily N-acetyltransferase